VSTPFYQSLDPAGVPSPVTPADGPGDAAGWAEVTPAGHGPAPYDISAPQDIAGIAAAASAAGALTGAGIVYPAGPRQAEAQAILTSVQGAASSNVFAGFPDYENQDLRPPGDLETPVQGEMSAYPVSNTYQDGIAQFPGGLGAGVEGVPPEGGDMDSPDGGGYPGTTQDGLQKYGTS
jgi:hypothetical protein